MKLYLPSLIPAFAFALAATPSVEGNLRGLSSLGAYLIGDTKEESNLPITNELDSSCEPTAVDVCIAIDRSGSICAPPNTTSFKCNGDPDCGCDNWSSIREFANAFIEGTDKFSPQNINQFGVVRFASNAGVETSLVDSAVATDAVTDLRYTSGYTNTADALALCREMLKYGDEDKKKVILLLTDGQPTRPKAPEGSGSANYDYAREQALEQAVIAKEEEATSIVGIFIKTNSGTSSYLEKLATPGLFFEVPDFDDLSTFAEGTVKLAQCPPPPPPPTPAPTPPPRICNKDDMNVCIAIDRSGSVCAPIGGPYPSCKGDPSCGDDCPEWQASLAFAKNFITSVDGLSSSQQFALVGFASEAVEESSFLDGPSATNAVENLIYSGGYTNTGDAIEECRRLLANDPNPNGAEKTIILITDGAATRPDTEKAGSPYTEAKGHAKDMSEDALKEDIHIVGVFVDTSSSTSSFLKELTSPGMFLEISEFDMLLNTTVSDRLVELVECSDLSEMPSSSPSSSPSATPSEVPSSSPTASPTCNPKNIDVCVAIDRSGSICDDTCPDRNDRGACLPDGCDNWQAQIDFANAFIKGATSWEGQQRFALATFGNDATKYTDLVSPDEALDVLDTIEYKFRWTNTFAGLSLCQDMLNETSTDTGRAIVLITDGSPTRPILETATEKDYSHAKEMASTVAKEIKEDGTTMITVAVNTSKWTSDYLKKLATEGFDMDVTNFDDLEAVSGRISALLSCA